MSTAYHADYRPPFPQLFVTLRGKEGRQGPYPALLDTGADATLIPTDLLETVGAVESHPARVRSQWGDVHEVQLYWVGIEIETQHLPGVYVIGDDTGHELVLGRDMLNTLSLLLDGPERQTELLTEASVRRWRSRRKQ